LLTAIGLRKRYRRKLAVDGVGLEVRRGEIVGLLGPNGAGKTTCFYMVAGLIAPDAGRITLDGHDITHMNMHRRAGFGLGYLPQDASVFRQLSVRDNVLAAVELQDGAAADHERTAARLLRELKIDHIAEQPGAALSGGERRRVEIARALAAGPRYLLLDEPFAGIDPITVGDMQQHVRALKARELGILITDHNVRETLRICDRAYIITQGRMLAEGTPEQLLADADVRRTYLGESFRI
jgi:lipopolysaccharide export system ATP-binding protein